MGDRGNIRMIERDGKDIVFYTHWSGFDLFDMLKRALKRGIDRWDDESYLARIIFCEMIMDDVDGTRNFGISTYVQDNEYPIFCVNSSEQKVYIKNGDEWRFEDFVELDKDPR